MPYLYSTKLWALILGTRSQPFKIGVLLLLFLFSSINTWAQITVNGTGSYASIQAAINAAPANATIAVPVGTYPESVTVNKALTINGAQAGIKPTDATSRAGGESIVIASANNTSTGRLFTVTVDNVKIDGFTLDGDNPSINGVSINSAYGITNAGTSASITNGLVIQNNIFKNLQLTTL